MVINTVDNIFFGQVANDTTKTPSGRSGEVLQKRQPMVTNHNNKSTLISNPMDSLISPSKISDLIQGRFAGVVADNFDECIEQKTFRCEIVVDNERIATETKTYKKIPVITNFVDESGIDHMKKMIRRSYNRIEAGTKQVIANELQRIADDPDLYHLLLKKKE